MGTTVLLSFLVIGLGAIVLFKRRNGSSPATTLMPSAAFPSPKLGEVLGLSELAKDLDRVNLPQFSNLLLAIGRHDLVAAQVAVREIEISLRHPATLVEKFSPFAAHLQSVAESDPTAASAVEKKSK